MENITQLDTEQKQEQKEGHLDTTTTPYVKVITHCDTFHMDEVTGTAMLDYLHDGINEIIRTRDQQFIDNEVDNCPENQLVYTLDVGKKYNYEKRLFDHHQTSFTDTFDDNNSILLSSCGLIWKHYGIKIIHKMLQTDFSKEEQNLVNVSKIYNAFYKYFVISIDGNDTGTSYLNLKKSGKIVKNFNNELPLGMQISKFNGLEVYDHEAQLIQFKKAMKITRQLFLQNLRQTILYDVQYNRNLDDFLEGFNNRTVSPEILVLNKKINVNTYLYMYDKNQTVKLIVVPRSKDQWQIWTVSKRGQRFTQLVKLINETNAKSLFGETVVFIHRAQFTGAFYSKSVAIQVCQLSLKAHSIQKIKKIAIWSGTAIGICAFMGICGWKLWTLQKIRVPTLSIPIG